MEFLGEHMSDWKLAHEKKPSTPYDGTGCGGAAGLQLHPPPPFVHPKDTISEVKLDSSPSQTGSILSPRKTHRSPE